MNRFHFRYLLVLVFLCAGAGSSYAQYFFYNDRFYDRDLLWEGGVSFGLMNSLADVGQKKSSSAFPLFQADLSSSKINGSIYWGALYKNTVGARVELTVGSVSGDDKKGTENRKLRNLSYSSTIKEASLITELHLINLFNGESLYKLSPYLAGGIGVFAFNPKTKYNGEEIELREYNTEGQGFKEYPGRAPYKLSSLCVPFGLGFKYEASAIISVRLEVLGRYALTDYLDDASSSFVDPTIFANYFSGDKAQIAHDLAHRYREIRPSDNMQGISRGGAATKDKYMNINLKVGYTLGRERIR